MDAHAAVSRSWLQSLDAGTVLKQSEQETCEDNSRQRDKDHPFQN